MNEYDRWKGQSPDDNDAERERWYHRERHDEELEPEEDHALRTNNQTDS